MSRTEPRIVISGGGTGGHIFPALAIADEVRRRVPSALIHFVGAQGRMEMERVPKAGYPITGLDIRGFDRSAWHRNLGLPFRMLKSGIQSVRLLLSFKPDVVIGTGGYASGPVLAAAAWLGYRCLIQEQNSLPGLTNRWLGRKVDRVCVAYPGLERYFPASKLRWLGNPIREDLLRPLDRTTALTHFGLEPDRPCLLVLGGSLGARSINRAVEAGLDTWLASGLQVIWQTGKSYFGPLQERITPRKGLWMQAFVDDMASAYAAADGVLSRAGATTLSELAALGKPSILVPSPNVAEDHQTHNARALSERDAAVLIPESEIEARLTPTVLDWIQDRDLRNRMGHNAREWGRPLATQHIVDEVFTLISPA